MAKQFLSDPKTARRFEQIVGMLGSSAEGERANAAALASRMLAEAGMTWAEVLSGRPGATSGLSDAQWQLDVVMRSLKSARESHAKTDARLKTALDENRMLRDKLIEAERIIKTLQQPKGSVQEELETVLKRSAPRRSKFTPSPERVFVKLHDLLDDIEDNIILSDQERRFFANMRDWSGKPTAKQWSWLCKIAERAGVEVEGGFME